MSVSFRCLNLHPRCPGIPVRYGGHDGSGSGNSSSEGAALPSQQVKQGNQTRGSYTYDGVGRRVVRTIGNSTTKPAYDGWNLVQERASNGNSVTANYLTGRGLDQPLLRTAGSSTSYYLSDALGSIVGLASTTGTVPTSYTYEPHGKTTVSGTASANFFGFTGRENDSTGTLSLYNYRIRSYSPALQRFLTEDPIGLAGGDVNLYAYVGNSPKNFIDPLGLEREGGDGGCGLFGIRCAISFIREQPSRVLSDAASCVAGAAEVFASIIPLEAAFPPTAVVAVGAGCVGGTVLNEVPYPH